jgi:hypothetical protein
MVTTINATNIKINYFYDYNWLVLCVILVINVCVVKYVTIVVTYVTTMLIYNQVKSQM